MATNVLVLAVPASSVWLTASEGVQATTPKIYTVWSALLLRMFLSVYISIHLIPPTDMNQNLEFTLTLAGATTARTFAIVDKSELNGKPSPIIRLRVYDASGAEVFNDSGKPYRQFVHDELEAGGYAGVTLRDMTSFTVSKSQLPTSNGKSVGFADGDIVNYAHVRKGDAFIASNSALPAGETEDISRIESAGTSLHRVATEQGEKVVILYHRPKVMVLFIESKASVDTEKATAQLTALGTLRAQAEALGLELGSATLSNADLIALLK